MTFKSQWRNFIPLARECFELLFECNVGDQVNVRPLIFVVCLCDASERMGKWFAPNAFRRIHGLEGTKRQLIRLLPLLKIITRITSKSKRTVKHPDFPSAMRPVTYSEVLPAPKPPENLT